ncbi:MAG: translation initiation factor IF-3 [Candidatus Marinimicrobia bacterium]|nr:translation initiation factor IF-3 [Candidatus Neomarinimicrobiota bacterium]
MPIAKANPGPRVNNEITALEVRLVGHDGEQLGLVSLDEALAQADALGLDLVEVAPQAEPPVCKILDFGKYRYNQQKRKRESKKKQHVIANKEMRMRPGIGDHDLETKINHAIKFLQDGSRLKVTVRFRGRELSRLDLGTTLLDRVVEMLADYAEIDKSPMVEGRNMIVYLVPKT